MSKRVRKRNAAANRGFARGGSANSYENRTGAIRSAGRIAGVVLVIAIGIVAVVAAWLGLKALLGAKGGDELPERITVSYNEDISKRYDREQLYVDNVLYIDFDTVAEVLSLTKSSFGDEVSYFTKSGDSITLTVGSNTAYVNKIPCSAEGKPFKGKDGELMAPAALITLYVNETLVAVSDDGGTVTLVTVVKDMSELSFNLKKSEVLEGMDPPSSFPADTKYDPNGTLPPAITNNPPETSSPNDSYIRDIIASYEFKTDISEYKAYLDPENASDFLILANRNNPLGEDYVPKSLATINAEIVIGEKTITLQRNAYMALLAMIQEMKAEGVWDTYVCSAYRSYEYQVDLYNRYIAQEKAAHPNYSEAQIIALVDSYSARPGTSDHQTGLCVDFYDVEITFEEKAAFKWLAENAYKFGFILRFPEGKTSITGYTYEPWHWRFVGQTAAYKIHTGNLTLEEFLAQ